MERILDVTAKLVVEEGVDAVGTRTIAEVAGVPVASLYQYFADKDEVLLALIERDIAEMDREVAAAVAGLERVTLRAIVEATMSAFVEVYLARPEFVMIYLRGRTNQAIKDFGRAHNRETAATLFALAEDLGLVGPKATLAHAELAVELGDRLFQIAFESSLTGDPVVLAEAPKVVATYLELYAAEANAHGVTIEREPA